MSIDFFDSEYFKKANDRLCAEGYPEFVLFNNQNIRRIRGENYDLKSRNENLRRLLLKAEVSLNQHRDKGHNDTCSYSLSAAHSCDCGLALGVATLQSMKDLLKGDVDG